jgi:L-ascorbate metabolism protein UlaG (beta-lactamase superfamily)
MLKVTFFGTTTLLFDDGKNQIFFDAHFTRPSLRQYIAGALVETNNVICDELIQLHHIDRLRAIFISHTHHDHVMDAPYVAKKCGAVIYGSSSAKNVALGGGVSEDNIVVFQHGSEYTIGDYKIRILKSLHSKPNTLNDDIGIPIEEPLTQPASLREYSEGGSFDFYIEYGDKKILIRPSFNYIEGQLDGIQADILFLGVAGLGKADLEMEERFFEETVEKTGARLVIPVHWDNFFEPLDQPVGGMPELIENTELVFYKLAKYCEANDINTMVQYPRTSIEIQGTGDTGLYPVSS